MFWGRFWHPRPKTPRFQKMNLCIFEYNDRDCYISLQMIFFLVFVDFEETCTEDMFDCNGDKKKCISRKLVCDYRNDCGNWNDEAADLCNGKWTLNKICATKTCFPL